MRTIFPKLVNPMLSLDKRKKVADGFKQELQLKHPNNTVELLSVEISDICWGFYVYRFYIDFTK